VKCLGRLAVIVAAHCAGACHDKSAAGSGEACQGDACRSLATPSAFFLATDAKPGAVLVWGDAQPTGTVLRVRRFGANGTPLGSTEQLTLTLSPTTALWDLSLVTLPQAMALAWLSAEGSAASAHAALVPITGPPQLFRLGPTDTPSSTERGNLALSVRDGTAVTFLRAQSEPCATPGQTDCFEFRFSRLGAGEHVQRPGLSLTVPTPCHHHSALLVPALVGEPSKLAPWHYAVCSLDNSEPMLTVFSIDPARHYAGVTTLLRGCQPLGVGVFAGDPSIVAQCGPVRRVASVANESGVVRDLEVRGLVCQGEVPALRVGDDWILLGGPQAHLEALLPGDIAPPGDLAVWTGSALVVAGDRHGTLEVSRHRCTQGHLQRDLVDFTGATKEG
jgi:hypothetical protein